MDVEHTLPSWHQCHDVSDWVAVSEEPGGLEAKTWLSPPGDYVGESRPDLWLYKPAKTGTTTEKKTGKQRSFMKQDHLSELIVHLLASEVGIPTAEVRLVTRFGQAGSISRNVTPRGWELQSGDTMLSEFEDYVSCAGDQRPRNRVGHHLDNIWHVLDGVHGPDGTGEAVAVFAGYLVLDAWVANTDRHAINWALLLDAMGVEPDRLSPSFDHGTAFGSGMTDTRLASQNGRDFARRGRAGRFENGRDRALVDLALDAVSRTGEEGLRWIAALGACEQERVKAIVDAVPGMSDARRRFTLEVLAENRRRLTA